MVLSSKSRLLNQQQSQLLPYIEYFANSDSVEKLASIESGARSLTFTNIEPTPYNLNVRISSTTNRFHHWYYGIVLFYQVEQTVGPGLRVRSNSYTRQVSIDSTILESTAFEYQSQKQSIQWYLNNLNQDQWNAVSMLVDDELTEDGLYKPLPVNFIDAEMLFNIEQVDYEIVAYTVELYAQQLYEQSYGSFPQDFKIHQLLFVEPYNDIVAIPYPPNTNVGTNFKVAVMPIMTQNNPFS